MRITKEGKLPRPDEQLLIGRCHHCGCEFECTLAEAQFECGGRSFFRDSWTYHCPTPGCGTKVELAKSK